MTTADRRTEVKGSGFIVRGLEAKVHKMECTADVFVEGVQTESKVDRPSILDRNRQLAEDWRITNKSRHG